MSISTSLRCCRKSHSGRLSFRRGVRSSRSASATATPAARRAWHTTCFMVSWRSRAKRIREFIVLGRTRRLRVVDRSSAASRVGGREGAVCAAIAKASSGDGRWERGLRLFTALRLYDGTYLCTTVSSGTHPRSRNSAMNVPTSAPAGPAVGTRPLYVISP
jgi:hypothetical protein